MNLAISGGALIAGVLLAWLIGHGIAGPVGSLTAVMKALAAGDLDFEIGNQDRGDEIGEMARAVGVFKTSALDVRRLEAEKETTKKLTEIERRTAMLNMADAFERSVNGVVAGSRGRKSRRYAPAPIRCRRSLEKPPGSRPRQHSPRTRPP